MEVDEINNQDPIRRIVNRLNERADRSHRRALAFMYCVVVSLAVTALVFVFSGRIAQKDVEDAQDVQIVRETLRAVHLNDIASCGETAVAVGDEGAVSISNDGAQSWKNVDNGFDREFLTVSFSADCSDVVAAGERGILLESFDGGNSWTAGVGVTENTINSVAINEDGTTRVAVGKNGLFMASSDGMNWEKMPGLGDATGNSVALSDDGQTAIVTNRSDPVRIFEKDRRGKFTLRSEFDGNGTRFEVVVVDDRSSFKAFAFGENRAILAYANQRWGYVSGPDRRDRRDIVDVAVHGGAFLAVGDDGLQMASTNGESWESRALQGNDLTSVAINGSGTAAVAVGADGTALAVADQSSWELINLRTTSEFSGVTFVSEDRFVIVGEKMQAQGSDLERTSLYQCNLPANPGGQTSHVSACVLADNVGKMVREEYRESSEDDVREAANGSDNARWWADNATLRLLQNNILRLGTITLFLFVASHLFRLARYHSRLAAYYRARADAFGLASPELSRPTNMVGVEQAMLALSPDHLETGPLVNPTSTPHPTLNPLTWFK